MTDAPPARHGSRFIFGPLLAAALGGAVWFDHANGDHSMLWALCGAFCAMGLMEYYRMCAAAGHRPAVVAGLSALVLAFVLRPQQFHHHLPWLLAGWVAVKLVARPAAFKTTDAALTLMGAGYLGLMTLLPGVWQAAPKLGLRSDLWLLLFVAAANKLSDTFAYLVGSTMGRHKMAPMVSPGKTWEGAVAGMVAGTLGAAACMAWPLKLPLLTPKLLLFAAAVTASAQLGDLVESAIKRWAGVKDSGRLVPGMGGALDIIDSFLVSIPVTVVYLSLAW